MSYSESLQSYTLPQNVVVIGGGTGNSTVLSGLSPYVGEGLTAVVTTFDDGGGTGKLRAMYPVPAMGDIRQCVGALTSDDARQLLNYRFEPGENGGAEVGGQTLGNLAIVAAIQQSKGDMTAALRKISRIFNVMGNVVPVSHDNRRLRFEFPDGSVIDGEHAGGVDPRPSFKGVQVGFDQENTNLSEEAEAAIKAADMVVIAPGDAYTSIAPNLVVRGMKEALQATKVVMMVSNLMNRNRHTVGFTTLDYVEEYTRLVGSRFIERVVINTQPVDEAALAKQAKEYGSHPVEPDQEGLEQAGYIVRGFDLLSREVVKITPQDALGPNRSSIRHDPDRVAQALFAIYNHNGFIAKSLG